MKEESLDTSHNPCLLPILLAIMVFVGRLHELWPPLWGLHLAKVTVGLLLFFFVINYQRYQENAVASVPDFIAICLLLLLGVISVPYAAWPSKSLALLSEYITKNFLVFFLIVKTIHRQKDVRIIVFTAIFSMLVVALAALLTGGDRISATVSLDPNDMAMYLITLLPFSVYYLFQTTGFFRKILLLAIIVVYLWAVVQSGSRGGFIALCCVTVVMFYRLRLRWFYKAILLGVAVIVFLMVIPGHYKERIMSIADTTGYEYAGATGRMVIWTNGLELISERPFIGWGFGVFSVALGSQTEGPWRPAHNSYIEVASEIGLGGLAIFLYLIYRVISQNHRISALSRSLRLDEPNWWIYEGLVTGCVGYAVAAIFLSQSRARLFYLFIALTIVNVRFFKNKLLVDGTGSDR